MKHIILCADDYGQTQAISQAIIELLKIKRLSAVSCMVTHAHWFQHAKELLLYKNNADIGLHLNFTEGSAISTTMKFMPLSMLLLKSHLHLLNKKNIYVEINAQLDRFIDTIGAPPDFIDGHQHIHQFPIIRSALLDIYKDRLTLHGTYIRSIDNPNTLWDIKKNKVAYKKKCILRLTGSSKLKNMLVALKIPHNTSFSGVYEFNNSNKYEYFFNGFLSEIKEGGLIMCHPGLEDNLTKDFINYSRVKEYNFIKSEGFLKILEKNKVVLTQFKELF